MFVCIYVYRLHLGFQAGIMNFSEKSSAFCVDVELHPKDGFLSPLESFNLRDALIQFIRIYMMWVICIRTGSQFLPLNEIA